MELIDTHCHLTSLGKELPLEDVFRDAFSLQVKRMVCIGAAEGIQSARDAIQLAETYPHVWASAGIHPHDAGDFIAVDGIEALVAHPRIVAVGETGLDYYRDWSPFENQRKLFDATIALAKNAQKPLIIHCRDALEDTFAVLLKHNAKDVGGVFHCYAGDAEFAKRLRDINFLVSFTGNLTFKKAGALRTAAKDIPLEQIMLETDCPYLAPEPFRGKTCEPKHVWYTGTALAELKGVPLEEIARITTETAVRFFGLT